MAYWKRRGTAVVGDFSPEQCRQLYWHVDRFHVMLTDADQWPLAPTSNAMDFLRGCRAAESHRRAAAIVEWRERILAADASVFHQRDDHLKRMASDAHAVVVALSKSGKQPVLTRPEQLSAWIWTLYECAMDIAFNADIPWGEGCLTGRVGPEPRAESRTVSWLLEVVDGLVGVVDFSVWTETSDW